MASIFLLAAFDISSGPQKQGEQEAHVHSAFMLSEAFRLSAFFK